MSREITIAIDAMGGENSPKKIVEGIEIYLKKKKYMTFLLYGDEKKINSYLQKYPLAKSCCQIFNNEEVVQDNESPLSAAKKGEATGMWNSINSQKKNNAHITLSAGNTGALLIISKMILSMIEKIDKPALAGLWPNNIGMNVVLDLGANIECNEKNLIDFSHMGAALHNALFPNESSNVALLNVGLEEIKGNETLKKAYSFLKEHKNNNYNFAGYIEGNHIMEGKVNVIITDGFTGNIALKTAEGTVNFISKKIKESFNQSILNKISMILSYNSIKFFKKKFDPRNYNGAILLGLNGPVVKSHGATDALGFANSIEMCSKIVRGDLIEKIKLNLSSNT